jgi:hypothetical protein
MRHSEVEKIKVWVTNVPLIELMWLVCKERVLVVSLVLDE